MLDEKDLVKFVYKINLTGKIIIFIYRSTLKDLINFYYNFKKIIGFFIKVIFNFSSNKNYIKKTLNEIIKELFVNIEENKNKFIKIFEVFKYMFNKYILNYSFLRLCLIYIKNLHITNLKLHIYNKLDIYIIIKIYIKRFIQFIKMFINYLVEKYYYKFSDIYFLAKYIVEPDTAEFCDNLKKIEKILTIDKIDMSFLEEEIESIIKFFLNKEDDYILKLI